MAVAVIMPRQGQSVETCILGQWYKSVGDMVNPGDLLFSYETDKAAFDEEAKESGVLLSRFFNEGDEVPVLANVAVIGQPGESFDSYGNTGIPSGQLNEPASEEMEKVVEFAIEPASDSVERIKISPLARNMAKRLGVDYTLINGSGPYGRIIARDIETVLKTIEVPQKQQTSEKTESISEKSDIVPVVSSGVDYKVKPLSNIRKLIAKAMHRSLQNSAQLTHHLSADARKLLSVRKKLKTDFEAKLIDVNITVNDLVCYSVIRVLKKFPQVNSHLVGDQMKFFSKVHLGLAVDTDRGLMVPALRNADDFPVTGLSNQLRMLAESCRKGNINPELLDPEAASFTVSNLGNYGVEMFTPVINLPQTAILGVCTITPRPKDIGDGVLAFVPMIGLSLTYDHQALDGGEATRFLAAVAKEIENLWGLNI